MFPDEVTPAAASYLLGKALPTAVVGNYNPRLDAIREFQHAHVDRLDGLQPVNRLGQYKLNPSQEAAFMKIRAGHNYTTPDGQVLRAVLVDGRTLTQALDEIVKSTESDRAKITSWNAIFASYHKLAGIELQRVYRDITVENLMDSLKERGAFD